MMSKQLTDHISKCVPIEPLHLAEIVSHFQPLNFRKKSNLLEEGAPCRYLYFVLKGCVRLFFQRENGSEQTTYFALEQWWITDFTAFQQEGCSSYYIQAVETTEVLRIEFHVLERLLADFPALEKYFRMIHQRANAAAQTRIRLLYELSREQLYVKFLQKYPVFVQRIPQYLLASFLGFTPEYLSEIRKKFVS
jgi:CRP/FNR family transcriptional regulator